MRVLFFNEGNLGTHILGQGQLQEALQVGLAAASAGGAQAHIAPTTDEAQALAQTATPARTSAQTQAHFAGLTPMGRLARAAATRTTGPLARSGLDFRTLRWHTVQALRARAALRRELRSWPADVVHVHSHSIALALAGTMRTVPVVLSLDVTVRDWWAMPAWRRHERYAPALIAPSCALERRALQRAALVLAWTAWAARAVQRCAPRARVVEHHPGIDLQRYAPAARSARACPRVLFVGGRFAEKGGEDLLRALDARLGRDVELDLVTPASIPPRPGVRVHRLSPSDPQLLELQQQADVMCLPTHADAAPWAVLEAMACATPVLATRIGGIPDLLDDGRAGVLVPHGDVRALRGALETLLDDPQRRGALGAAGRARCERRYDARRQFTSLLEHLDSL